MKCHSLTTGRNTRSLRCLPSLVSLLVVAWQLVSPASASILQERDFLELRPPSRQTGLYFGFSLAHYINNGQRWLLVGAPRSDVSKPDVKHSGGLYQCPLSDSAVDHECQEVYVNLANNAPYTVWAKSNGSEQSLGFSLASSDNEIVVCAPRWYGTKSIYNKDSYQPVGMCYSAKAPAYEFGVFSPPFDVDTSLQITFATTGSCQVGMSATYVKEQNTFALGGPGCWGWQGDTWEVELNSDSSRYLGKLQEDDLDLEKNQWSFFNLYMGYSVASFKFGSDTAILSSIPRAIWPEDNEINTSFGPSILILGHHPNNETLLSIKQRITPSKATAGEVAFSFFGYSLATLDVNGDGLEDLVVGAPLYHRPPNSNQGAAAGHDHGAVFVYMQTAIENLENKERIYQMKEEEDAPQRIGSVPFSRFGSCVAAVGDLDGDGYEDLAVGAPFMRGSSEDETGAVYIYMGSKSGLEKDALQIIRAAPSQKGFGSSIAQRLEIVDGKGYDVVIGSYESDQVLVFKSKDVVEVTWNLTFSGPIDFLENNCACQQYGASCPCVDAKVCVKYKRRFNKFEDDVELDFAINLATDSSYELTFDNGEAQIQDTISVKERLDGCTTQSVMAKPGKTEIKSYTFTAELKLAKVDKNMILDRHADLKKDANLNVFIHCAARNVSGCKSNVNLQYDILAPYIYASQPMEIKFHVTNQEETAYDSRLVIKSSDVFNIVEFTASRGGVCEKNRNKEIECNLGNLENNYEGTYILRLTPSEESLEPLSVYEHGPTFDMTAEVKTLSNVSNPNAAVKNFLVDIIVNGSMQLFKKAAHPTIVFFNSSSYYKSPEDARYEEELGPEIKHTYSIMNSKDFSFPAADLIIHWPLTIAGKYFLYLMKEPEFSGINSTCEFVNGKVDPYNLANKQSHNTQAPEDQSKGLQASALTMGIDDESLDYMKIICHLGVFSGNKEVTVMLRSRLVLRSLNELAVGAAVKNASSFADLQITTMPFNVALPEASHSAIVTEISYKNSEPEIKVPIWYYIVSGLAGFLVLGVLIFILWKCGFFKRKRVQAADKTKNKQEQEEGNEDQEANLVEDKDEDVKTPLTPMLQETECAKDDFEFQKNK